MAHFAPMPDDEDLVRDLFVQFLPGTEAFDYDGELVLRDRGARDFVKFIPLSTGGFCLGFVFNMGGVGELREGYWQGDDFVEERVVVAADEQGRFLTPCLHEEDPVETSWLYGDVLDGLATWGLWVETARGDRLFVRCRVRCAPPKGAGVGRR